MTSGHDYGAMPERYVLHDYGQYCECFECTDREDDMNQNYQRVYLFLKELSRIIDGKSTDLVFLAGDNEEWLPKDAHRLILESENYLMTCWYAMQDAMTILEKANASSENPARL